MSRIVKIVILSVIAGILIGLVAWGIAARNMIYFSAGRLMFGERASQAEGVSMSDFEADVEGKGNIRLDFVSESIDVVVTDGDAIRIEEKSSRPLNNDELMVCSASGDTVSAVSGLKDNWHEWFNFDWVDIQITLYVPAQYRGNIDVYSTSGRINVADVQTDTLKINSTSGALYLDGAKADSLQMGSTSGAVQVQGGEYGDVRASSVSGAIRLDAASMDSVKATTTSGAVAILSGNMPAMTEANSVSGSVTLKLPENDGFTLETDTVSGGISNDFAMANNEYKDGKSSVSVDTVSGSINIIKK
jgi:lia operon protein LiaG